MAYLKKIIHSQRNEIDKLKRQNAELIDENKQLRKQLRSYTHWSPGPPPSTARQLSVSPPTHAAPPSNDDGTPIDDFDESRQARPWCKPPVPWYEENHLTREHRRNGHPGFQGIDRRNTDTNYSGKRCNPCERDGAYCNGMGPCNRCLDTRDICWYFPCGYGTFCTKENCGRLHPGQDNPWNTDPGLPTIYTGGFNHFMKSFQDLIRKKDDFAEHRHRTTVGGTEERPIVID